MHSPSYNKKKLNWFLFFFIFLTLNFLFFFFQLKNNFLRKCFFWCKKKRKITVLFNFKSLEFKIFYPSENIFLTPAWKDTRIIIFVFNFHWEKVYWPMQNWKSNITTKTESIYQNKCILLKITKLISLLRIIVIRKRYKIEPPEKGPKKIQGGN